MTPIRAVLEAGLTGRPHPTYPGAVALVLHDGAVVEHEAVGFALRYGDASGTELPVSEQVPMAPDTVFDLASLTKLFTTTALLTLVDEGTLALDSPIHPWLPTFASGVRRSVSLRHLLSHTSGLAALRNLWTDWPNVEARRAAVLEAPLERGAGAAFSYSDLGFMVAGWLAEAIAGTTLARLVTDRVCRPLGMTSSGFLPAAELVPRIAATEDESYVGRGMLQGSVHDENAWSLGGAVGHAGMFGTAADLARLGEMIRLGGALDGVRVLREETIAEMCTDQLPASLDPGFRQGLGVRIDDPTNMGALAGPATVGHTGFTGTSLVVDREHGWTVVLLTNRVHPSRTWSDVGHVRRSLAEAVVELGRPRGRRRPMAPGPDEGPAVAPRLLVRIRAELPTLRPAELRVALAILADPAAAAHLSIGTLAERCETSAATVLRFCRAVGFRSYPALRLELARETGRDRDAPAAPSPTGDISPTDTVPQIVAKIAWSDARAIEDTAALLDVASLARAIDAVAAAERIDIYGVGASGFVAADLHQKLHRIGLLSSVSPDPHAALTSAALLGPADVAIAISHTGTTTDTVEALRVARAGGATTIAITNVRDSPITAQADLVLTTAARETTFRSGAMASRIAQLAVVDCLFVGVAQRSWDRTLRALERTFVAVQGRRIPAGRRRTATRCRS
jgi:DNA-binding MurR/RpiR family transcriptional regulator/CubicO group peptidase (beta-lactamase class C family)